MASTLTESLTPLTRALTLHRHTRLWAAGHRAEVPVIYLGRFSVPRFSALLPSLFPPTRQPQHREPAMDVHGGSPREVRLVWSFLGLDEATRPRWDAHARRGCGRG